MHALKKGAQSKFSACLMHGRPCPKELTRELGLEPVQVKLFRQREKGRATDELETNNSEAKRPGRGHGPHGSGNDSDTRHDRWQCDIFLILLL